MKKRIGKVKYKIKNKGITIMTKLLILVGLVSISGVLFGCAVNTKEPSKPIEHSPPKFEVVCNVKSPEPKICPVQEPIKEVVYKEKVVEVVKPVICDIPSKDALNVIAHESIDGLYFKDGKVHDINYLMKQRVKILLEWSIKAKKVMKAVDRDIKKCYEEHNSTQHP